MRGANTGGDAYSYLEDLNDYAPADRWDYLRDLPVRPAKRKRWVEDGGVHDVADDFGASTAPAPPYYQGAAVWLERVSVLKDYVKNRALVSAGCASLIATALSLWKVGKASRKEHQANTRERTPSKRKKRRKRKAPSRSICAENSRVEQIGGEDEPRASKSAAEETASDTIQLMSRSATDTSSTCDSKPHLEQLDGCEIHDLDNTGDALAKESGAQEASSDLIEFRKGSLDSSHGNITGTINHCAARPSLEQTQSIGLQISDHLTDQSYHQMVSRWESRGLDRQKSLELAATFEMNLFFFEQIKRFLSGASVQLFCEVNRISSNMQRQIQNSQVDAIAELPELEQLRRHREGAQYALLNTRILARCLLLAATARIHPHLRTVHELLLSPSNALSTITTSVCPGCIDLFTGRSMTSSLASLLWNDLLVEKFLAAIRSFWFAFWLAVCHRFVSRSLCYAILAVVFAPWREVLAVSCTVLALNTTLTVLMTKKCENIELTNAVEAPAPIGKRQGLSAREMNSYYARIISRYQYVSYVSAFAAGICMAVSASVPT